MTRLALVCSVVFALWAAPLQAGRISEEERRAVALLKQAIEQQKAGSHARAISLCEQAWAVFPHPKALFFKARSLVALERWEEAQAAYKLIRTNVRDLEEEKLREVDAGLERCERELKETRVRALTPGVEGALIQVDGKPVGGAPAWVALRRGRHVVRAEKAGYLPAETAVVLQGEAEKEVHLTLVREVKPTDKPPTPPVEPGGALAPTTGQAVKERTGSRPWAWVTAGAGVAALGTGVGLLGNYAARRAEGPRPGYHLEGSSVDLGVGSALAFVGAGLGLVSWWLFK